MTVVPGFGGVHGKHRAAVTGSRRRSHSPAGGPDRGATATEYAILVAFIALVVAAAIAFFGTSLSEYISRIATGISAVL